MAKSRSVGKAAAHQNRKIIGRFRSLSIGVRPAMRLERVQKRLRASEHLVMILPVTTTITTFVEVGCLGYVQVFLEAACAGHMSYGSENLTDAGNKIPRSHDA